MATQFDDPVKEEVWRTLEALNDAWTQGDPEDLRKYFHKDMVAIAPNQRERIEGGEACRAAWSAFAKAAKIHHFKALDPKVQVYGDAAVVTYYYDMSFEMEGKSIQTGGRDMFTFAKENGTWWAVADQFSPYPGGGVFTAL